MRALIAAALAAVIAGLAPVASLARDKPSFEQADANGDGRVSVSEAKEAGIPASKAKANDLNGDGKLTKADWRFIDLESETDSRR